MEEVPSRSFSGLECGWWARRAVDYCSTALKQGKAPPPGCAGGFYNPNITVNFLPSYGTSITNMGLSFSNESQPCPANYMSFNGVPCCTKCNEGAYCIPSVPVSLKDVCDIDTSLFYAPQVSPHIKCFGSYFWYETNMPTQLALPAPTPDTNKSESNITAARIKQCEWSCCVTNCAVWQYSVTNNACRNGWRTYMCIIY